MKDKEDCVIVDMSDFEVIKVQDEIQNMGLGTNFFSTDCHRLLYNDGGGTKVDIIDVVAHYHTKKVFIINC